MTDDWRTDALRSSRMLGRVLLALGIALAGFLGGWLWAGVA